MTPSAARSAPGWNASGPCRPAGARAPRSRSSTSAPRTAAPSVCGARTWRSGGPRFTGSAASTRRSTSTGTRRTGRRGCSAPAGTFATSPPRRRVLVAGVDRPELDGLMGAARAELAASRHAVEFAVGSGEPAHGKFENLNALLAARPAAGHDWLLVVDDDVVLPRGFLDRFLFLAERFDLRLAQPAHRRHSHAAWSVTRR